MHKNAITNLPRAVLFDLDNTLYAYDPAHHAGLAAVREKAERMLGLGADAFDAAFKKARSEVQQRLGATGAAHSRLLYFQRLIELVGMKTQVLLSLDFEQTYWRTFLANAKLFSGVKEFLEELKLLEIPTSVVTDLTAQIQFRKIVYFQLENYFDFVVTSEEAGADKPQPAPFQLAVEKLGVSSGPIWMIGDNPNVDIRGARDAVGAITFQKKHSGVDIQPDVADMTFESFSELVVLLQRLTIYKLSEQLRA